MESFLYCIKDKVTKRFAPPFIQNCDEAAQREFENAFRSNQMLNRDDFALFKCGQYDVLTGVITPLEVSEVIL